MTNNKLPDGQCGICADCVPQINGGSGFNNCAKAHAAQLAEDKEAMNNKLTDSERMETDRLEDIACDGYIVQGEAQEMARELLQLRQFNTATLINKFYTRYPLEDFKSDTERSAALGYYMAGACLQRFGGFAAWEITESDDEEETD